MEAPVRVEERLLTAEEFYDLYAGQDFELVRGKVVDARSGLPISEWYTRTAEAFGLPVAGEAMTAPTHGLLECRLSALLEAYLAAHPVGNVGASFCDEAPTLPGRRMSPLFPANGLPGTRFRNEVSGK